MTSIWKLISFQIDKGFPANANSQTACYNHIKRLKLHQQCDNLATLGTKPQMHTCLASWGIEKKSGIGREYESKTEAPKSRAWQSKLFHLGIINNCSSGIAAYYSPIIIGNSPRKPASSIPSPFFFSRSNFFFNSSMRSKVEESFTDFFEKWMAQLEECAHSLLIENEKDHNNLVNKMTTHYKNYYTAKWAAAREDVLAFFAPVWLTSLESAYVWVTGWKPSTAFRLVPRAGMSEEQAKKVEVMKMADCVRLKTLKGLLDVLGPTQSVHFLASASMLQIQMRKWRTKASSAHQSGNSLGTAASGEISRTFLSFSITSLMVGIFLVSCRTHSYITSHTTASSSLLKDFNVGSTSWL
nr:protein DOG1-like 4 [Ipomoea batatas]